MGGVIELAADREKRRSRLVPSTVVAEKSALVESIQAFTDDLAATESFVAANSGDDYLEFADIEASYRLASKSMVSKALVILVSTGLIQTALIVAILYYFSLGK